MISTCRRAAAALLVLPFLALACGDDDDTEEASASRSASGSASASASGSASGSVAEATCTPVGEELEAEATETVEVHLEDYSFDPSSIEVAAGTVTFTAENAGTEPHELAFLPGGGDVPFIEDGGPDETALEEAGAFELEAFGPGESCNATYELEPGTYTIFCIVESEDGETHYEKGMRGTLEVA